MSIKNLPTRCIRTFDSHEGPVHIALYNSSGEYLLSGGQDKKVCLWNPETGLRIKTYTGHGKEVLDISVTIDHTRFVSCGGDRQVYYWDVATGRTIRRFEGHNQRVNTVDFNMEGTVIASGSYDTTIRLWDCRSQSRIPIQILEEAKDSITSLQISQYEIVSGCTDGNIRTHDIRMGTLLTDLISYPVTSVTVSNDFNCILTSSLDSVIRLMDRENGGMLNSFKGHNNSSYKIHSCLSRDDAYVISGSENGAIYIWDLLEGKVLTTISNAHSGVVTCVKYHPRIDAMVSTSIDGVIKLWKPANDEVSQ
ncbi:WD40-repeat-containing domain protein [Gigaspora rosea]|uniref:WD40-repeat-containing domain protein n=1 Tax=Gigaspora rosea TaxID=44941 RepID=A0A397VJQ1_9GLOM|nr:WD40-repeat-containing domain protein [Gigaspora rosea]